MRRFMAILFILIFSFSILGCDYQEYTDSNYAKIKTEILSQLNDPDSYEMEYVKHTKSKIVYKVKFRAKNGFGAMKINYAYASFHEDGKLKSVDIVNYELKELDDYMRDTYTF